MEMATFAIENAYAEAIIRGFRASFLTQAQYAQMKGYRNLQQLKAFLEDTDYGEYVESEGPLSVSLLRMRLKRKLADEIDYVQSNSTGVLVEFLDMIAIRFQIDNLVNLIEGLKNKVDIGVLLANVDPLGEFPEMRNVKVLEGDDYFSLYRDVLIDTPVGPYFMKFLQEKMQKEGGDSHTIAETQTLFRQLKPEEIRTSLKKSWLEQFAKFCQYKLNPTSTQMMEELVKFEADFKTIQVIYNSINNKDLNTTAKVTEARKKLCPALGWLYPDAKPALLTAVSLEQLKDAVKGIPGYAQILNQSPDPSKKEEFSAANKSLDDVMYDEECKRYALAFDQCNHVAVFYAYLKLKEQQIRNIVWMAEMISRHLEKGHQGWAKVIIPFSHLQ